MQDRYSLGEFADDDLVREPFQRRHYVALWFWRTLRRPLLHTKRITRLEVWLCKRAARATQRIFGWA